MVIRGSSPYKQPPSRLLQQTISSREDKTSRGRGQAEKVGSKKEGVSIILSLLFNIREENNSATSDPNRSDVAELGNRTNKKIGGVLAVA